MSIEAPRLAMTDTALSSGNADGPMQAINRDDGTAYMLLPRETWETAMAKLEQLNQMDHRTRSLANDVYDLLIRHAPWSWLY
jgi:hypothetical protein